jgi:hypothetical protein
MAHCARQDVDSAINVETLKVFGERAKTDLRFKEDPAEGWTYTCQEEGIEGVEVNIKFLELGKQFIQKMHGMTKFGDIYLASLADIMLVKAHAYQSQVEDNFKDVRFALRLMAKKREAFWEYQFKSSDDGD